MSLGDFSLLCPALLHQIDEGACIVHGRAAGGAQRGTVWGNLETSWLLKQREGAELRPGRSGESWSEWWG